MKITDVIDPEMLTSLITAVLIIAIGSMVISTFMHRKEK